MKPSETFPAAQQPRAATPDVLIERLVPGGHGFAKLADGRALLVPGALPGDRVRILEQRLKSGAQYAEAWTLEEASPERVTPVCEVQQTCGGCDLMALDKSAQTREKLGLLRDALVRVGGLDESLAPDELVTRGPDLGYRSRLRLQVSEGRIGFFQRSTRTLVQPKRCHVARPELEKALSVLRRMAHRHPASLDAFSWVEVRASSSKVAFFFQLSQQHSWVPVSSEALLRDLRRRFLVATSGDKRPSSFERFQLSDHVYMYAAPGAFTQVNWPLNCALAARVVELAAEAQVNDFLDLYCGSGNFSLPLLAAGLQGVGVESSLSAIAAATQAAREQGFSGRFVADDAARYAERALADSRRFDLLLLDPPRAGVKHGLDVMLHLTQKNICMIGCDPVTFARDLSALVKAGFQLEQVEAFDMFPQTHHVEVLAWLSTAS